MSDYLRLIHRRALTSGDPSLVQLWFDAAVIERYRAQPDMQVIRTDTAGRVRKPGAWAIDCGIADDDAASRSTIHCSWSAIAALPDGEREHWAAHAVAPGGVSENFLRMQLSPGSCFDDGDTRTW
jgi:hypothetical protein